MIWKIDSNHSAAEFKVQHLGISWVRGHIFGIEGEVQFNPENLSNASFKGSLDLNSLTTGVAPRDGHLKSPDFFDVEKFQKIFFESKEVKLTENNQAILTGILTIKDISKEVALNVEFLGTQIRPNMDGSKNKVAAFTMSTSVDRRDFGLTWNVDLDDGNVLVGNRVDIIVDIEAVLQE